MSSIRPVLGTMTFGPQVSAQESATIINSFQDLGFDEIDTAYVYNKGDSEKFLGQFINSNRRQAFSVATKVNPRVTGKLDHQSIRAQLEESLERLNLDCVDILYLHFPDPGTPIKETLSACATLYAERKFKSLGLSNYPTWEVASIWHICKYEGWPLPVVYQGLYNFVSRSVEPELIPALRKLGIRFYAYNPLAGGLLSGKYSDLSQRDVEGRFTHRPNYRDRYWKQHFFDGLALVSNSCQNHNIPLSEAALRWLLHHSALAGSHGDRIILGISKQDHLDQNLAAFTKPPLPEDVVHAINSAWDVARLESPAYFRSSI